MNDQEEKTQIHSDDQAGKHKTGNSQPSSSGNSVQANGDGKNTDHKSVEPFKPNVTATTNIRDAAVPCHERLNENTRQHQRSCDSVDVPTNGSRVQELFS